MLTALVSTGGRETLQSSCRIREVTGRKGVGQAGAPLEREGHGMAPPPTSKMQTSSHSGEGTWHMRGFCSLPWTG